MNCEGLFVKLHLARVGCFLAPPQFDVQSLFFRGPHGIQYTLTYNSILPNM